MKPRAPCPTYFFDPDKDPIFVQGVPTTDGYAFLSFLGEVREVDFSGAGPVFHKPWSLVSAAEKEQWRPGASRSAPFTGIWANCSFPCTGAAKARTRTGERRFGYLDMKDPSTVARWPVSTQKLAPVIAVQVSRDDAPILFAGDRSFRRSPFSTLSTGHLRHVEKQLGQTPWLMLNP